MQSITDHSESLQTLAANVKLVRLSETCLHVNPVTVLQKTLKKGEELGQFTSLLSTEVAAHLLHSRTVDLSFPSVNKQHGPWNLQI